MWKSTFKKMLNSKIKKMLFAFFFLLLSILCGVIGYQLVNPTVGLFFDGDNRTLYFLFVSLLINVSIISSVLYIILKVITPEQNEFSEILGWFPITNFQKNIGYRLPIFLVICCFMEYIYLLLLAPSFLANKIGFVNLLLVLLIIFIQSILILSIDAMIYNFLNYIFSILGFTYKRVVSIFILIVIISAYYLETYSVIEIQNSYFQFHYNLFYLLVPIIMKILGAAALMNVKVGTIVLVTLICLLLALGTLFLNERPVNNKKIRIFKNLPIGKSWTRAIMTKEVKMQCRNDENFTNCLVFFLCIIILKIRYLYFECNLLLICIISVFMSIIAINSYGNEEKFFPMYKIMGKSYLKIMLLKIAGLMIVAIAGFLVCSEFISDLHNNIDLLLIGMVLILDSIVLLFGVGVIFPVNEKNPYIGMIGFVSLLLIVFPLIVILSKLGEAKIYIYIGMIVLQAVLTAMLCIVARWREMSENG